MPHTEPSQPAVTPRRFRWRRLCCVAAALTLFSCLGCENKSGPYVDRNAPPIVQAAQRGDFDSVKRILATNASALYHADAHGSTAAHWAILNDHPEIALFLIQSGYPINPRGKSDFPLVMCCVSRYTDASRSMLRYLLEHGADPNATYEKEGWIALNMAAQNGQEENVRLLVEHGAKLDSKDSSKLTPLELARQFVAQYKNPEFNYPHGELSDPAVRQAHIEKWERMVKLLTELEANARH